jgi:hypothetical protein
LNAQSHFLHDQNKRYPRIIHFIDISRINYSVAHGLKIQGRGYLMFFFKIPRGSRLSGKIALGGLPFLGFIAFLLTSVLKFD